MRIHVSIPGSVESFCIDERGDKREATEDLWLETYLCSVLRAYSYADDGSGDTIRKIMGVRRFNPVTNTEAEHRFLNAAERLFFRGRSTHSLRLTHDLPATTDTWYLGWQLGSDSVVQVPTNVSNHLTSGLLRYLATTGRYPSGINLFEKLRTQSIEVSSLLAKVLFMGHEEVSGVRTLYQALGETPMDYVMLDTQAEFLLRKAKIADTPQQTQERLQMALKCADRSTMAAPSEFGTWARLAEVYVAMGDWENALVTLNSCPMFTYQDKDTPIMPEPKEVHLPTLPETRLDEIDSEPEAKYSEQVDPNLLGLRAASYKGTFKQAYSILTEMASRIGWDQLLKIRSTVFVMEDEYRTEKNEAASKRNPSIEGMRGTPIPTTNGKDESEDDEEEANETVIKLDETESTADTLAPNGSVNIEEVEKPSSTIDPTEVKTDPENVSTAWSEGSFNLSYTNLSVRESQTTKTCPS